MSSVSKETIPELHNDVEANDSGPIIDEDIIVIDSSDSSNDSGLTDRNPVDMVSFKYFCFL